MIVSIISPKGGCGKSTTALTLASVFSNNDDLSVGIIDADPRQAIARVWINNRAENKLGDPPFEVISQIDETEILDEIERSKTSNDLTFIDVEGVAGLMAAYAASAANLCIVPMRASALDGDAAGSALKLVASAEKQTRRKIPAYILLAQTEAAVKSTSYFEILREFREGEVVRFSEELNRRAAFERIVAEGRTLFELETTKAVTSAIANAARLGTELAGILEA